MPAKNELESPLDNSLRLQAARLAIVYGQGRLTILVSPLIACFASYALWEEARHDLLIGWVACLFIFSILRTILAVQYHKHPIKTEDVKFWERLFVITLTGTCMVWGIGGWIIMRFLEPQNQILLYYFLVLTAAGAITSYGAHKASAITVMLFVLLPTTIHMFMIGNRYHISMGLTALFFAVVAAIGIRTISEEFGKSLILADQLEKLSLTDSLSGLANRRAFTEMGENFLANAIRSKRKCGLLILDVDFFKSINDRLGHAAGDHVIRSLGEMLSSTVREGEFAARIGGEEFAIILPDTTRSEANKFADRIQRQVRALRPTLHGNDLRFTVSIGVSVSADSKTTFDALLAAADEGLYKAKNAGRNRTTKA